MTTCRILGRQLAHEMTAEEIEKVSGAAWYGTNHRVTAIIQPQNRIEFDERDLDVIWD